MDLAAWMKDNKEEIAGAKVWRKSEEGPTAAKEGQFQDQQETVYTSADYRFTANNGAIYAIALKCPEDGVFTVKALADSADQNVPEFHGIIEKVEVLGFPGAVKEWKTDKEGLHVTTEGVASTFPVTLKITVE